MPVNSISSFKAPRTWLYRGFTVFTSLSSVLGSCVVIPIDNSSGFSPQPTVTPSTSSPTADNLVSQSSQIAQMETQVWQRINQERQQRGLQPLRQNAKLNLVARNYSKQMAQQNFFSHNDPQGRGSAQRVEQYGISYNLLGENLFKSINAPNPVPLSISGWMKSPGHRQNILRSTFTETGVGVWRTGNTYYFTQLFMRPL